MFGASFDYYKADSVEEAIDLLGKHEGALLLAGGHSLIPMMKLRLASPSAVIDIGRISELRGIHEDGGTVRVGALTTHRDIAASSELHRSGAVLAEAAAAIGDPQVRNFGTIGGNLMHADPASDLPAAALVLDATVVLSGPRGERRLSLEEFHVDLMTTAAEPDEMLTAVEIPELPSGTVSRYLKTEHPASGYAVCGAAAVGRVEGKGLCRDARLAFNGVATTPFRHDVSALVGSKATDEAIEQACRSIDVPEPLGDEFASGEFRVELARVYGSRALREALR